MKENARPRFHTGFLRLLLSFFLFSFFTTLHAQTVSGTVTDEAGKNLVGVSVTVRGASSGATTDEQGRYRVNAGANATLLFSYVGYGNKEEPVSGRSVV